MHALALVLPVLLPAGTGAELQRFSFNEPHMGTRFEIICYAATDDLAKRAVAEAFARIAELESVMSDYRPSSELTRLCAQAGGGPVAISADLFEVLSQAQDVACKSAGAFDVTAGPVTQLWRRARKVHEPPNSRELADAQSLVGYQKLSLDPKNRTAKLEKTGMKLDLGGIGKGFAGDEALAVLKEHGLNRALIAAGGDIVCGDAPPDAPGWKIAVSSLDDSKQTHSINLANAAVSTSGDNSQHLEANGKRYSHVIDPRTGRPLTDGIAVTVVAPRGRTADPLTKVLSVLGPDEGRSFIEATEHASALIACRTDEKDVIIVSDRFPKIHPSGRHDTEKAKARR